MSIGVTLKAWARRIKRDGVTLWFAGKHPGTPWYAKALGLFVVAYALSPIDLIPDFIPVLGYVDDVILLPVLIWLTVKLLPSDVLAQCRIQADEWMLAEGAAAEPVRGSDDRGAVAGDGGGIVVLAHAASLVFLRAY